MSGLQENEGSPRVKVETWVSDSLAFPAHSFSDFVADQLNEGWLLFAMTRFNKEPNPHRPSYEQATVLLRPLDATPEEVGLLQGIVELSGQNLADLTQSLRSIPDFLSPALAEVDYSPERPEEN